MSLILVLLLLVAFIVVGTAWLKLHPFLVLLIAAFLAGLLYGLPIADIPKVIGDGFGAIMGQIGLVIVLGTVIGVILERSGAAISMADAVVRLIGARFPTLTVSIIGYIVSIPVFCDSAFVILNSLKEALAARTRASPVALSVALATGLYATHTFVPPTPGPIAAAGNVGLADLGLLIALGAPVALVTAFAGLLWANRFLTQPAADPAASEASPSSVQADLVREAHEPGTHRLDRARPGALAAFAPIFVPILLICVGSVAALPTQPFDAAATPLLRVLGHPLLALLVGLAAALPLLTGGKLEALGRSVSEGMTTAAPILLITGAGGAFGAVLRATPLADALGKTVLAYDVGLLAPFIIAAGFKTAQGSTTVALVATSAIMAPLLTPLGLDTDVGRVLVVLAIGSGAMTVSHVNDSFFWVVSQFSRMTVAGAYRAFTIATLIQGLTGLAAVYVLRLVLL